MHAFITSRYGTSNLMHASMIKLQSTKSVQIIPMGPKMAHPGGHMLYIGLNREKHEKKIFLFETIRPRALIFSI